MVKETGRIVSVEQKGSIKVANVECLSRSACSSCQSNSQCGVGVVAKGLKDKTNTISVPYREGMQVDQYIDIEITGQTLVRSAFLLYLLPLFVFIGTASLLSFIDNIAEPWVIVGSILSTVFTFLMLRLCLTKQTITVSAEVSNQTAQPNSSNNPTNGSK